MSSLSGENDRYKFWGLSSLNHIDCDRSGCHNPVNSAILPTRCGTISDVYSLMSLGFCFRAEVVLFVRIRKAVDVGLFPFRTLWNGACQFSSFVCAGMVPTIFLPGWLLFPFTRVLCESAGRDVGRGVCSVLLPLLLRYGTSPLTSQSSVTRTFRQGPLCSPPCLANVLNG